MTGMDVMAIMKIIDILAAMPIMVVKVGLSVMIIIVVLIIMDVITIETDFQNDLLFHNCQYCRKSGYR